MSYIVLKSRLFCSFNWKNIEDLEENQNFLDLFKTYPATLKNNIGNGLVYDRFKIMSKHPFCTIEEGEVK